MSMIMYYFYNFCQLLTGLQFIFAAAVVDAAAIKIKIT